MAHQKLKCCNSFCPNRYDDVVGLVQQLAGAQCLPCFFAEQMLDQGRTPADIEAVDAVNEPFVGLLTRGGWTWNDLKAAYDRMASMSKRSA